MHPTDGPRVFEDAALGYDEQDFEAVKALEVGESVSLDAGDHAVLESNEPARPGAGRALPDTSNPCRPLRPPIATDS